MVEKTDHFRSVELSPASSAEDLVKDVLPNVGGFSIVNNHSMAVAKGDVVLRENATGQHVRLVPIEDSGSYRSINVSPQDEAPSGVPLGEDVVVRLANAVEDAGATASVTAATSDWRTPKN